MKSIDDAVEWVKRAPFEEGDEVEIRHVFEADDFGKEFTPELRAREERLRARIGEKEQSRSLMPMNFVGAVFLICGSTTFV